MVARNRRRARACFSKLVCLALLQAGAVGAPARCAPLAPEPRPLPATALLADEVVALPTRWHFQAVTGPSASVAAPIVVADTRLPRNAMPAGWEGEGLFWLDARWPRRFTAGASATPPV